MSSAAADFGVLLNLAYNSFVDALWKDIAAAGFDDIGPSFGYVFRLLAEGTSTLSELAAQLQMTSPGALKVIDDMVGKGYVSRSADASDGRVKRLALTARGRAALAQARKFHARCERDLERRLGKRTVAATRQVLEALASTDGASTVRRARPA